MRNDVPDVREPLAQRYTLGRVDLETENLGSAVQLGVRVGQRKKGLKFLDQFGQRLLISQ